MRATLKKLIVVMLAFAMVMGLTVTSFAAKKYNDSMNLWSLENETESYCVEQGESVTFYAQSTKYDFHASSCELLDGCEEYIEDKSIKVYVDGVLQEKTRGRDLSATITCDIGDLITIKYKKGRVDINFKSASTAATSATDATKATDTTKAADTTKADAATSTPATTTSTDMITPTTAAEAQALVDYYSAVIKKNKLENTGAAEEQLLAYYKALVKQLSK